MTDLSPDEVFEFIAENLPSDSKENIVVIGSLAAAYHFFRDEGYDVRTKDVDCLLRPREHASKLGSVIAVNWLNAGWTHRALGGFGKPQSSPVPVDGLSVLRLQPEQEKGYFVEFLAAGESEDDAIKSFVPVEISNGEYFALASFRYLRLVEHEPLTSHAGLLYARPSLMALANLLTHQEISSELMSAPFEGRKIKRFNKDLGRSLALAWLDDSRLDEWTNEWFEALESKFPTTWQQHAPNASLGVQALLDSPDDVADAFWTWQYGLLASFPNLDVQNLTATGRRLLGGPLVTLTGLARS